ENVISGDYELSRPFSYVTRRSGDFKDEKNEQLVVAFLDYLNNSIEGREAVAAEGGIVNLDGAKPWSELKANHSILEEDNSDVVISLGGSTSVEETIVSAYESFIPFTNGASFESNLTGSGDGYKRVLGEEKDSANYADIGFASRDFKAEEDVSKALDSGVYCKDAIVVVVSKDFAEDNTNLTKEQVYNIFTGEITTWDMVEK
ncbi:MAG: substrate-binding domain-containing protein, partial [Bacilli bacterium]